MNKTGHNETTRTYVGGGTLDAPDVVQEKKNSDGRLKKLESTLDAENKDLQRAQANKAKSHQRYLDMQEAKSKHDKAVADAKQNLHDLSKDVAKFNKADRKKKIMEPDGVHGNPIYKRASGS